MYGTVNRIESLGPSMQRIVFGGPGLDDFEPTPFTDQYVNASFTPEGTSLAVPFDPADARELGDAHRPRPRRYTVRAWDPTSRELTIDFVAHGDEGFAGPWAQRAQPGDRLQMKGPSGSYAPNPEASRHLFCGDESALPAIAASVESLPSDALGAAHIVVDGSADEVAFEHPSGIEVTWWHRDASDDPSMLLARAVEQEPQIDGTLDVFVHGEAEEVRAVRLELVRRHGIDPKQHSISPYWRRTCTDEQWRAVKRQWTADVSAET